MLSKRESFNGLRVLMGGCLAAGLFMACLQDTSSESEAKPGAAVNKPTYVPDLVKDEKTGQIYIRDKEAGILYLYGGNRRLLGNEDEVALAKAAGRTLKSVQTDWSGQVQTAIWECSTTQRQEIQTLSCPVDPDWVLIGGGARTVYYGSGALLTEARPHDAGLVSYTGASKSHKSSDPHDLYVYAIGLKLVGVPRQTLYNQMTYDESEWSGYSETPLSPVNFTSRGWTDLSGGAKIEWTNPGNMLFANYPRNGGPDGRDNGWTYGAGGKSHKSSSPARIKAYALGINHNFTGWGELQSQIVQSGTVTGSGLITASQRVSPGWVMAGVGAYTDFTSGSGRLLSGMYPNPADPTVAVVNSKDHLTGSSGPTIAWVFQVRKKP